MHDSPEIDCGLFSPFCVSLAIIIHSLDDFILPLLLRTVVELKLDVNDEFLEVTPLVPSLELTLSRIGE